MWLIHIEITVLCQLKGNAHCNLTFVYARLHYVCFLIHQDRKFMLHQSFLPSVHSGSQKQMFIIIFERLGLRAASSLNVFSLVLNEPEKVHLWQNIMSSALFCFILLWVRYLIHMFIICRIVLHVMLYILFYSDKKVTACASHGGTHPVSATDLSISNDNSFNFV